MDLTDRDRKIILLLKEQGFATFEQIRNNFFPDKTTASRRLKHLEAFLYIRSELAKNYLAANDKSTSYFPYLMSLGIHPKTKIYYLNSIFRKQFPETNRLLKKDLCLHQIMLNEIRFSLEKTFPDEKLVLNDPDHKLLSEIDLTKRKEFTPDLMILNKKYSIAVELERTAKGMNRYQKKFWYYEDSSFTHVLYFYVNEGHLKALRSYAGLSRKFAFSHYYKPNLVISNTFGHMELIDWVTKLSKLEGNYE